MIANGPIIDPTVGRLQPWQHYHQDRIPKRDKFNDKYLKQKFKV